MSHISNGNDVVNAMTIDVEDYFHVSVFDGIVQHGGDEQGLVGDVPFRGQDPRDGDGMVDVR